MSVSRHRRPEELSEDERNDLVCLGVFTNARQAHEAGTVILAMNEWYILLPQDGGLGLNVRSAIAAEAGAVLRRAALDNVGWPPPRPQSTPAPFKVSKWHLVPVPLLLAGAYTFSLSPGGEWVLEWGRFDSARISAEQEWWRLATPLFLHGDIAHLLGNIVIGLFFGHFLARYVGIAATYAGALLAGILGNLANLLTFAGGGHISIGASTAVFGLLGGLLGHQLAEVFSHHTAHSSRGSRRSWKWIFIGPVGASLALLGMMGAGGERTDVLAHLYGFFAGALLFAIHGLWSRRSGMSADVP